MEFAKVLAYIVVLYSCITNVNTCLNGFTCRHSTMECLAPRAPNIPFLGKRSSSITTAHITSRQLPWAERVLCLDRYRLSRVYLHGQDQCHSIKICEKTISCW